MRQKARSGKRYAFAGSLVAAAMVCGVAATLATAETPPPGSYDANPPSVPIGSSSVHAAGAPVKCHAAYGPPYDQYYCYSPADMRAVYNIPSGPGADGSGQTIIAVVAYGSRTIQADLAAFDSAFGLPNPSLTILGPNGSGDQGDPIVQGWIAETSLDVEWAHAIAPGASLSSLFSTHPSLERRLAELDKVQQQLGRNAG